MLATATLLVGALLLVDAVPVQAHTCNSVCNQIRRACRRHAKAVLIVDYTNCDDQRDGCLNDCDLNVDQCPIDCDNANTACVGACDPADTVCLDGCAAGLTQCLEDCANCKANCRADRVVCRDNAKLQRDADNVVCDGSRESCQDTCVDPIDSTCVRGCKADKKGCDGVAKRAERTCKRACPTGSERRACFRNCKREKNVDYQDCSDREIICLGGCAGL
jgi:hypothetical protein